MDIKNMHEMIEMLVGCTKAEFDKKGIEQIDAEEMGKVTDMIKDLAEAQYYRTLVVAMEESEYGEDYDENGPIEEEHRRGYRGQRRNPRTGRYMRRGYDEMRPWDYDDMENMEHMRDMDRHGMNRMYFSGDKSMSGNTGHDYREGQSGRARKGYMEAKELHKDNPQKMKELENYMRELANDVTGMIHDASPEEKNMLKSKMQELLTKIN